MKKFLHKKRTVIISVFVAVAIFISVKAYEYASAPDKEKNCDFIYPSNTDQTKPTTITISPPEHLLAFQQKGGVINDASCLNKTSVYGVVKINSVEDIKNALQFARENNLKVTSAGQRHSMGGQSFIQNGLVLDM